MTVRAVSGSTPVAATCVGTGTIVTADGSEIEYQGAGTIRAGRAPGSFREDFRATVTGGTGKWEGISGKFRVQLVIRSGALGTPVPFTGRFTGFIVRNRA